MEKVFLNEKIMNDEDMSEIGALLFGDSVFTSALIKNGKVIFWKDHLERLRDSLKLHFKINDSLEWLECELSKKISKIACGYLRITFYPKSSRSLNLIPNEIDDLNVLINVDDKNISVESKKCKLLDLGNIKLPSSLKVGSYANQIYWKRQIVSEGYDDFIRLADGKILEGSTSNIFLYFNDNIFITPTIVPGVLDGIARKHLLQYLRLKNYKCIEREITKTELFNAKEVFLTNAVQGIVPISEIDNKKLSMDLAFKLRESWRWS